MRVLELLRIVRKVANLPNFGNKEATRQWLVGVVDTAWTIPSLNGAIDDDAVALVARLAGNKRAFEPLHRLLLVVMTTDRALTPEEASLAVRPIAEQANAAGVHPMAVLVVVECMAKMIKLVRDQ